MSPFEVFSWSAERPGKHLLVLGAIHGNEVCGPTALRQLMDEIECGKVALEEGTLTLIPICSPRSYELKRRFVEQDLNRVIESHESEITYEQAIANALLPYIDHADYVMDLHSFSSEGEPFCIVERYDEEAIKLARSLGLPKLMRGFRVAVERHSGRKFNYILSYGASRGVPGVTVECGKHDDPKAADEAYRIVRAATDYCGIINSEKPVEPINTEDIVIEEAYFYQAGGKFTREWNHFDFVPHDTPIAELADGSTITAPFDAYIIMPTYQPAEVCVEWFYLAQYTSKILPG